MSSLKNAIPRRAHKERAQPAARKRYGLLEKHKDYVLRAKDFHKKEDTIKRLREKAAFKNPDEFYFKMENSVIREGVHHSLELEKETLSHDELLLMKTQDIRYVLNKAQSEVKKVEKLKSSLHLLEKKPKNKHIMFNERGKAKVVEAKGNKESGEARLSLNPLPKRLQKKRTAAYKELEEHQKRAEKMADLVQKMALQKELMKNGRKRKVTSSETGKGPVYVWKKERKR